MTHIFSFFLFSWAFCLRLSHHYQFFLTESLALSQKTLYQHFPSFLLTFLHMELSNFRHDFVREIVILLAFLLGHICCLLRQKVWFRHFLPEEFDLENLDMPESYHLQLC